MRLFEMLKYNISYDLCKRFSLYKYYKPITQLCSSNGPLVWVHVCLLNPTQHHWKLIVDWSGHFSCGMMKLGDLSLWRQNSSNHTIQKKINEHTIMRHISTYIGICVDCLPCFLPTLSSWGRTVGLDKLQRNWMLNIIHVKLCRLHVISYSLHPFWITNLNITKFSLEIRT